MDDDPNVRRAMQRALSLMGYRVDVVVDGREAVTAYERALVGPSPYALAILDLTVVGGTGGKEAAQKLRRIDPQAVIVVSSGYSDEGILADPRAHGFDACLPKPYDESELALVLRRAFSGRSPGPGLPG
jgi:CheY-like chemotaxis protein